MKGHLRQRGKRGTWYLVIDERDPSGRRKRRWINLHTTKKREAEDARARILAEIQAGALPQRPPKLTVADLIGAYIESRRVAGRAPRTLLAYEHLERRIVARIGQVRVADLTPALIEAFYADELAKPLSPRTVRHEHDLLRAAFKHAVRQGTVARNPLDAVTPPRAPQREQRVLTPDQVATLLRSLQGHRLYALIFLAISTGMRQGELIGLRWADVDLDGAVLYVRVQRQYLPRQGIVERETKEHRGTRPIELTADEVAVLRRHRAQQAEEKLRLGPIWQEHGLVFPSEVGTPLNPRNVQRFLDTALRKAGLPDIRFHDLRHTAGTLLLREDGRLVVAQRRLGHARPTTTANVYGHVLPGDQREAAAKVLTAIKQAGQISGLEG